MAWSDIELRDNGATVFDVALTGGGPPPSVLISQFRTVMRCVFARVFGRIN